VLLKLHPFEDGQFVFEFSSVSQSGAENINSVQSSPPIQQINFMILALERRHLKFSFHCNFT